MLAYRLTVWCGAFLAWSCGTINHVFGLGHIFSHFGHAKGQWQCVVFFQTLLGINPLHQHLVINLM
jgi:hypothetical protein